MLPRVSMEARFDAKVRRDASGCWLWIGSVGSHGYGQFASVHGHGPLATHRYAWERRHDRPVPCGMMVLHRCDVKRCVNPDHLFLGTHQDNMTDMKQKGRADRTKKLRGVAHPRWVRDDALVLNARALVALGNTHRQAAKLCGTSKTTVTRVIACAPGGP